MLKRRIIIIASSTENLSTGLRHVVGEDFGLLDLGIHWAQTRVVTAYVAVMALARFDVGNSSEARATVIIAIINAMHDVAVRCEAASPMMGGSCVSQVGWAGAGAKGWLSCLPRWGHLRGLGAA